MNVFRLAFSALILSSPTFVTSTFAPGNAPQGRSVSVPELDCGAFARNVDGSWTSTVRSYVTGPGVRHRIEPETRFTPGKSGPFGLDLADALDRGCGIC